MAQVAPHQAADVRTLARLRRVRTSAAWGENGLFWISFKDMEKLIKANGEACTAFEQLAPAQPA